MHSLLFELKEGESDSSPGIRHGLSFAIACTALGLIAVASFMLLKYEWNWSAVWEYRDKFISGWLLTLGLSALALVGCLLIGILSALASRSRFLPLRYSANIYIELTRGTPLLTQIFFFYYVIFGAAKIDSPFLAGVLIMSLFSGAYISEIIRGGIDSVGKSQLLSAKSIGFDKYQVFRYVVFPQAIRRSLPALAGQSANLIKDSSLLSVIALNEFTQKAKEVNADTYSAFESFFPLAIGYLILTLPIMWYSRRLEKRMNFET